MLIEEEYAALLEPEWHTLVTRDRHPGDDTWVYTTPTERPDAAPLLLLHGIGNDGGVWAPIMPTLAQDGPVVAPTVSATVVTEPGGGRSPTIDPLIDHLAAVVPPPWRIVGHSMGGVLTGLIVRHHPELVVGAVLVNSPLPGIRRRIREGDSIDRTGRALLALKALARVSLLGRPRLPKFLRGPELIAVRTALGGFVMSPRKLDDRVISRAIMSTRTKDANVFIELASELIEGDTRPFTERPVEIVLGRGDPLIPEEDWDDVQALYPDAPIHVLERCSHFAYLEQPMRVVELIREALPR